MKSLNMSYRPIPSIDLLAVAELLKVMAFEETLKMEKPGLAESTYSVYLGHDYNRLSLLHCAEMLRERDERERQS